ncbi:hypothetical protein KI387_016496 [Taxus chinensis]|uniref:Gamma carbonic anhydrase n=1 Tax=Taxus chinensis TaxID=29808 RepID=A0AA38GH06_TAXCH|nr:hypothetical protein KI387_016496 [Taxus chinensis]
MIEGAEKAGRGVTSVVAGVEGEEMGLVAAALGRGGTKIVREAYRETPAEVIEEHKMLRGHSDESPLQRNVTHHNTVSRHRTLMNIFDKAPILHKDVFVAPCAAVIGDVKVGPRSSIWYGSILRGDVNSITVGSGTNIQDNTLVHVAKSNLGGKVLPTIIGSKVTIGHGAVLHGCTIEDEAFVGMGATLLDGVVLEKNAMVAAGSLVRQNARIPSGEVWAGNPAKFLRKLTDEEIAFISQSAVTYEMLAEMHARENAKGHDQIESDKLVRKKLARQSDDYDSFMGVTREIPPEFVVPERAIDGKPPMRGTHYL